MPQPRVELEIGLGAESWGKIVLELDEEKAPATVKNFLKYVDDKFYDGTIFHRVISHFMIQGGGSTGINQSKPPTQPAIKNEAANGLTNVKGSIAMARTNDPHSATSQFFINCGDNHFLNHPGHDGWGYCVFGKVVEGTDVVDRIRNVETKSNRQMAEDSEPLNPPVIRSARRV